MTSGLCEHWKEALPHSWTTMSCEVLQCRCENAASGILTIAFMMRLSGIALGTLLLMLVPR